jgi:DNA-binding SARP family transcriptional activator
MNNTDTKLEIRTLGHFSISIDGKLVAKEWPDETLKVLFCSLLSPLDLYFTWDQICRAMWEVPETRINSHRLEELFIRPLNSFLVKELGFSPLMTGSEGIRINRKRMHLDVLDFYNAVLEGDRLLSRGNCGAALTKFSRADDLYVGSFLPGMQSKIIKNARNDLELLYRTAVKEIIPQLQNAGFSGCKSWAEPGMYLIAA